MGPVKITHLENVAGTHVRGVAPHTPNTQPNLTSPPLKRSANGPKLHLLLLPTNTHLTSQAIKRGEGRDEKQNVKLERKEGRKGRCFLV